MCYVVMLCYVVCVCVFVFVLYFCTCVYVCLAPIPHSHSPSQRCPRALYELMIECWHPVASRRPTSKAVCKEIARIRADVSLMRATAADSADTALQNTYKWVI